MTSLEQRYLAAKRALFEKYYGAFLNPEQCRAVLTVKGPLLILAGAGSGKTTVLVNRICHIIKYGLAYESEYVPQNLDEQMVTEWENAVHRPMDKEETERILNECIYRPCPPWAMLAITFTNKAAREIKERLRAALQNEEVSEEIWAGTFHSICVRILRRYGERVGLAPAFSIYDTSDTKHLITEVMRELNIDDKILPIRSVMSTISAAKNELTTPEVFESQAGDMRKRHIAKIYLEYQARLQKYNAVDFDDIIMKTVTLLEEHPDVADYYQSKFSYVCVDEYQDTNPAQFKLTHLLSAKNRNIMVVGDDDQSIYRFRGATVENILQFDSVYTDATVIKLEQNYRSTSNILDAANAVIANNEKRHGKTLRTEKAEGEKITLYRAETEDGEARFIVDTILHRKIEERRSYRDFAVLYRLNAISRSLETAFAKSGVPYRLLGGTRFYDRKEVKDILAYLFLLQNTGDDQRLRRIVNEPKRKLGDKTIETVAALSEQTGGSMFDVMLYANAFPPLSKVADKLIAFAGLISDLQKTAETVKPSELIPIVMEKTGYLAMLKAGGKAMEDDIDNLNELISAAVAYEEKTLEPTLAGFLEEAVLVSDVDKYDETADAVVLMTVHSAKGLEFPIVFLAGAEEGIFPGSQSINNPEELPEERRLAYVAITRAKEKLYATCTAQRLLYGQTQRFRVSRFFGEEIPPQLLEKNERRPLPPPRTTMPTQRPASVSSEFSRRASVSTQPTPTKRQAFVPVAVGERVLHASFGEGTVLSVRSLGADELYEIAFDNGERKKLMATYAKLKKL